MSVLHHEIVTTSYLLHDFSAIFLFSWHESPWSARAETSVPNNTHNRRPACPLQDSKPHSQQASGQLFYNTGYQFITDRELAVNRMIPDGVLPNGEDSEPCWSLGIRVLLLWACCLRFLIMCRSAQTTSGTDSAIAPERPQLSIHVHSLSCRQYSIKLFIQLHTDTTYTVPNEFLHNFTFSHAGTFTCHTVMTAGWQYMLQSNSF